MKKVSSNTLTALRITAFITPGRINLAGVKPRQPECPGRTSSRWPTFLPGDIYSLLGVARFADVHYLSGFNGSLLKVQARPTEDAQELAFLSLVEEGGERMNGLQGYFKQVADTLQVDVIESNEVWSGKRAGYRRGSFLCPCALSIRTM